MGVIDILFTSEWVSTLFIVVCAVIAAKSFVLPIDFEKKQKMRLILMKRLEECKGIEVNVYGV